MAFFDNPILLEFYNFFLALCLGAIIGLDREKSHLDHKGSDFAGIRTFMLICLFGALSGYLAKMYYPWIIAVALICLIGILIAAYLLSSWLNKKAGMTTEMSAIIAFIIGILVYGNHHELAVALTVATTLTLSFRRALHDFAYKINSIEFYDTIKFILIAFVILPLLKPIKPFGPFGSINLYEIWLMVVFVSSLSYFAYILIKVFGSSQGTFLTGILGGVLSSTATVTSLANKSKENKDNSSFVAAAAIACSTMFFRVLIEVSILNISLIEELAFPMVLLTLVGFIMVSILWKTRSKVETKIEYKSPLLLGPAITFGLFYGFINFISSILNFYFGSKGILIAAIISGFADLDAIAIYIARNPVTMAVPAIILAATVNTIVKVLIARIFGKKDFGNSMIKVMFPVIITGIILFFVL